VATQKNSGVFDMMKADGLEKAIVGICRRCGQEDVILYDEDKVIKILMEDGMGYEEAVEYYEYNIIDAWVGDGTPAFCFFLEEEELKLIDGCESKPLNQLSVVEYINNVLPEESK
tara:strand:- start:1569 stop:1913 length:345 start_codon:yes stop_codon:yes gene_type:complete